MQKPENLMVPAPLPLKGTHNTRELGGYPTHDGRRTRTHLFLRSDALHELTSDDLTYLMEYGVRDVIDLRSSLERKHSPDRLSSCVHYEIAPMMDHVQSNSFSGALPPSMAAMYRDLLDSSRLAIRNVFQHFLSAKGCTIFHCTAGKDRTGIVSMLLLGLAGVPNETIIADYAATERNMAESFAKQLAFLREKGLSIPDYVGESKPISMKQTMEYLDYRYGGSVSYLLQIGLTKEELAHLKQKFIEA